jgi:hypothetical protein
MIGETVLLNLTQGINMPNCTNCGREVFDWEMHYYSSFNVCSDCYRRRFGEGGKNLLCTKCTKRISEGEADRSLGTTLCKDCLRRELERRAEWTCAICKREIRRDEKKFRGPEGKIICEKCAQSGSIGGRMGSVVGGKCSMCGTRIGTGLAIDKKRILCRTCAVEYMKNKKVRDKKETMGEKLKHLFGKE